MSIPSALESLETYEAFLYGLRDRFLSIEASTLVLIRRGRSIGEVQGTLGFLGERVELLVHQIVDCSITRIEWYSYELRVDGEAVYWYDSQPHPHDPTLAGTHPHHKHIPPDIKHHRIPAPGLSFEQPNVPLLIREIEALLPTLGQLRAETDKK